MFIFNVPKNQVSPPQSLSGSRRQCRHVSLFRLPFSAWLLARRRCDRDRAWNLMYVRSDMLIICWLYADFPPLFRVPGWLYLKSVGQIYLQSLQLQGPPISYNGCFLFCIVLGPTEPLTWKMAGEIRRRSGDAPILKWGTPFWWLQGSFSIHQQLFCSEMGTRLTWPPNAIILEWCVTPTSILIFLLGVGWYEMLSDFQGLDRPKNWRSTPSRS